MRNARFVGIVCLVIVAACACGAPCEYLEKTACCKGGCLNDAPMFDPVCVDGQWTCEGGVSEKQCSGCPYMFCRGAPAGQGPWQAACYPSAADGGA